MIVDRSSTPQAAPRSSARILPQAADGSFAAELAKNGEAVAGRALGFQETGLLGRSHSVAFASGTVGLKSIERPDIPAASEAMAKAESGPLADRRPPLGRPDPVVPKNIDRQPSLAVIRQSVDHAGAVPGPFAQPAEMPDVVDPPPRSRARATGRLDTPRHSRVRAPLVLAEDGGELTIMIFDAAPDGSEESDVADQLKATAYRYGYGSARVVMPARSGPGKE